MPKFYEIYETTCSDCGKTIDLTQDDIDNMDVFCPACGANNRVFSMDCPTCGEHFVYNASAVFCLKVQCPACGNNCEPDVDPTFFLVPVPLDDEDEDDEDYVMMEKEKPEEIVEVTKEEKSEGDVENDEDENILMRVTADQFIEQALDGREDDDCSMKLFAFILLSTGNLSTHPYAPSCQYMLKALYRYYEKNPDEKIESYYSTVIDNMACWFSSKENFEAIKTAGEYDSLTPELGISMFFEIIQTELQHQKLGISPFKTLKIADSINQFVKGIRRDPFFGAKQSLASQAEELADSTFETYADILNNADSTQKQISVNTTTSKETTDQSTNPMEELNALIGLSSVKKAITELRNFANVQQMRKNNGLPVSDISCHLVFTGNPGTGKTTVARLVAQIYKELGLVSKGHLVEASAKELIAGYTGQTAIKTGEVIKEAMGGVLFIDEAYSLLDSKEGGFGQQAIDTLLKEMEDHRDDLAVIVAGYLEPMEEFIHSNPGLESRFNRYIHFEDYTPEELFEIFQSICKKNAYATDENVGTIIKEHLATLHKSAGDNFANARTVRNLFETIIAKQATRISNEQCPSIEMLTTITVADVAWCSDTESDSETLEDILAELNSLIGLGMVKDEVADLVHFVEHQQRRKAQGLRIPSTSLHLVFMGNPGTGKTTVARYIGRLYKCLGLLSKGHTVEKDRSGLVDGFIGQTEIKTKKVIDEAMGGVLFIDEAYTLSGKGSNDYGQEAIDILLKAMEDKRDNFAVIVAGYPDLMDAFIQSNPGLESRFNRYIHFEDYSADEMLSIFKMSCDKNQYILTEAAELAAKAYFDSVSISDIANGRGARNLFEKVVTQQAKRTVVMTESQTDLLSTITEDDIKNALEYSDR